MRRPSCPKPASQPRPTDRLPAGIWVLGGVSLLMDVSSEMVHALLPLFMVTVLGSGALAVGLVEGLGEATAMIVKVLSGVWSDRLGRRKGLALFGYGLGAATKPLFALAPGMGTVLTARLLDRVGKGVRGAPRDALVADIAPPHLRGAAFGLRQSLDTVGACLGPALAVALMLLWANDFRAVFAVAAVPGLLAVALLLFGLREPDTRTPVARTNPFRREALARLDARYRSVVAIGGLFALARFSEAFLVLKAAEVGVAATWVPLVLVCMNLAYSLTAYPVGRLSDRVDGIRLLALGMLVLIAADLVLAASHAWQVMLVGTALWGLHMGLTQGLLAKLVADAAPVGLRGTAFGLYGLVSGVATLLASAVAGLLWDRIGSSATFLSGAGFCAAALVWLCASRTRRGRSDR